MNIVKPQVEIVENTWDEIHNKAAILRAAGTCRRSDPQDYDSFVEKWIVKQSLHRRHLKLLEHSCVSFLVNSKDLDEEGWGKVKKKIQKRFGKFREMAFVNVRDWKKLFSIMLNDNYKEYVFYGSVRDIYELSNIIQVENILKKYGIEPIGEECFFFTKNGVDTCEKEFVQIKIKTNRFTAMQLRTHQSISWLCESTRSVDYGKEMNLCTIETIGWMHKSLAWFSWVGYKLFRKLGFKKEDAGRFLTDYRETHIIGFAEKETWLDFCRKRIGTGAQGDACWVAQEIQNIIRKEEEKE